MSEVSFGVPFTSIFRPPCSVLCTPYTDILVCFFGVDAVFVQTVFWLLFPRHSLRFSFLPVQPDRRSI